MVMSPSRPVPDPARNAWFMSTVIMSPSSTRPSTATSGGMWSSRPGGGTVLGSSRACSATSASGEPSGALHSVVTGTRAGLPVLGFAGVWVKYAVTGRLTSTGTVVSGALVSGTLGVVVGAGRVVTAGSTPP